MYFYRIYSSDPSKSEGLDGKLYLTAALAVRALTKSAHFWQSSAGDDVNYHNGCCAAWIVKENIKLPDTSKKFLFDNAKAICDRKIHILNSQLIRLGISQEEFARIAHIDSGNLSKILSGVIYPNLKTYTRLSAALTEVSNLAHMILIGEDDLTF